MTVKIVQRDNIISRRENKIKIRGVRRAIHIDNIRIDCSKQCITSRVVILNNIRADK